MTERLYYTDCYLRDFDARIAAIDGGKVYLDRTAFYPASGGQPSDTGTLGSARVVDVIDEGERIAHIIDGSVAGEDVNGRIDWPRRFDHMQQHTGQHLLSAVLVELFGMQTVSFHMGQEVSTIDLATPSLSHEQIARAEQRANEIVCENRPVSISFQNSEEETGLRKASQREGVLRVISIENLDRSACGGTHLRSTGEAGPILLRKLEKLRGNIRIEFLCGHRAVRRARADYDALARIGHAFSSPLDETPVLVEAQLEKARDSEKSVRRLRVELAGFHGRALYEDTAPDGDGVRRVTEHGPIDDDLRARAQAFASGAKAIFLALSNDPPSVLLAVSADSGVNAAAVLKAALAEAGGRGGGSATLAQGSVPSHEALQALTSKLKL
ncbi:MAG TPA: alanyl-tRNA editing protein [Bryobacteraceae bacterium]|nr:alanyl-tRNA editing protein [Bryobacteraceae bacterium]